jgi:hypothetical protein
MDESCMHTRTSSHAQTQHTKTNAQERERERYGSTNESPPQISELLTENGVDSRVVD